MAMYYVSRKLDLWTRWGLLSASTPLYNGSLAEVIHLRVNFMCFIWHILLHFSISSVILAVLFLNISIVNFQQVRTQLSIHFLNYDPSCKRLRRERLVSRLFTLNPFISEDRLI